MNRVSGQVYSWGILFFLIAILTPVAEAYTVSSQVLPQGRFRSSLIYTSVSNVDEQFNGTGNSIKTADAYNFEVNAQKLQTLSPRLTPLIQGLNQIPMGFSNGKVGAAGTGSALGDALTVGNLEVDTIANRRQMNLYAQTGLTDRITVGFTVPLIHSTVQTSARLTGPNTAQAIHRQLSAAVPLDAQTNAALSSLSNFSVENFQQLLVSKGYDRFQDFNDTGIGDTTIGVRFKYYEGTIGSGDALARHAFQANFIAPTGKVFDPKNITAIDRGQGSWGIEGRNVFALEPTRRLTLAQTTSYRVQLPGDRTVRVPENEDDLLPGLDRQETVSLNRGDTAWTGLSAQFAFSNVISTQAIYAWEWKFQDRYNGTTPGRDYGLLARDSSRYLETFRVEAIFSSVASFLENDFAVPGELILSFNLPVTGKNTPIAPYGAAELGIYF